MLQEAESTNTPKLDKPGKGLPKFELLIARLLVGWKAARTSRARSSVVFNSEMQELLRLSRTLEPAIGGKQVLIKRLRGLEDSSRFWSVYMTIEHLRIVNHGTLGVIQALVNGETPKRVVSTADVKPRTNVDGSVLNEFETTCKSYQNVIEGISDLNTERTWTHPWFGELNAARWHFFAGFHMALHRKQILAILEKESRSQ